jgi:hypothetical protein
LPIRQDIANSFCFTGAETEIHKIKDDSKIIRQTNLDRRGLRPIPIITFLTPPPLSRYTAACKQFKKLPKYNVLSTQQREKQLIFLSIAPGSHASSRIFHWLEVAILKYNLINLLLKSRAGLWLTDP